MYPTYLQTDSFLVMEPITIELYLYQVGNRNTFPWFMLVDSSLNQQILLNYSATNFQIKYGFRAVGTCLQDVGLLPVVGPDNMPSGRWYHTAITWEGANNKFKLYQDGVLYNPGYSAAPCNTASTPFTGQIWLFRNSSYYATLYRDLRAVRYIKSIDEINYLKRKNHYYSNGMDNSPLFILYYPLDDITPSFCYKNVVNGTSTCLDPNLPSLSSLFWRPIILVPLYVCPETSVYNSTTNMCEQGQAYPGYALYFYLTGSNQAFYNQGITFWTYINVTTPTSYLLASYVYKSKFNK